MLMFLQMRKLQMLLSSKTVSRLTMTLCPCLGLCWQKHWDANRVFYLLQISPISDSPFAVINITMPIVHSNELFCDERHLLIALVTTSIHCTASHTTPSSPKSLGQERSPAFASLWPVRLRSVPLESHLWNEACIPTSWKTAPEYGETPKSSRANPSTTETHKTPALESCDVGREKSHDGKTTVFRTHMLIRISHWITIWMGDTKSHEANNQLELIAFLLLPCRFL